MKRRLFMIPVFFAAALCMSCAGLWIFHVEASTEEQLGQLTSRRMEIGLRREALVPAKMAGHDALIIRWYFPFASPVVGPPGGDGFMGGYRESGFDPRKPAADFSNKWTAGNRSINIMGIHFNRTYARQFAPSVPQGNGHESIQGRDYAIVIPDWFILFAGILPAGYLAWRLLGARESSPMRRGTACRVCGYDLRATRERCPECGTTP